MTVATTDIPAGASIVLQGSATNEAESLVLSGAAPTGLNASVQLGSDAALQFGSGAIGTIGKSRNPRNRRRQRPGSH